MANISGAQVAFWPTSSFKKLETISGGKLSMESRMMLLLGHLSWQTVAGRMFKCPVSERLFPLLQSPPTPAKPAEHKSPCISPNDRLWL